MNLQEILSFSWYFDGLGRPIQERTELSLIVLRCKDGGVSRMGCARTLQFLQQINH